MIEKTILKTLVYRDLFDYPLKAGEIYLFLIQQKSSRRVVARALRELVAEGKIQQRSSYYYLPGREGIVALRRKREVISREKLKKAVRYARLLRPIPWVKAVSATGALAVENADEESDLDLLIITTPRRLWLSRALVFLILSLLGVKRKPGGVQTADKVCPNMFLSMAALTVPDDEQNLYTAHEIVQARPIWECGQIHQHFLAENSWVRKFLPNFKFPPKPDQYAPKSGFVIFDWLEVLAYKLQLKYMERRRTREVVTPERILFHPIDRAAKILPRFEEQVASAAGGY